MRDRSLSGTKGEAGYSELVWSHEDNERGSSIVGGVYVSEVEGV